YLLDRPLPAGASAVAIATGFVNEVFRRNTIDCRGGTVAAGLVLVGNHYGVRVAENHLLGAGAMLLSAAPTEEPCAWGWSHAPFFGALVEKNTVEDSVGGCRVMVEHSDAIKSSRGRVYMTIDLKNNTTVWTEPFLAARARKHGGDQLNAWRIG